MFNSVLDHLPSMSKVLDLIPSIAEVYTHTQNLFCSLTPALFLCPLCEPYHSCVCVCVHVCVCDKKALNFTWVSTYVCVYIVDGHIPLFSLCIYFYFVLRIKSSASHLVGKHSTNELYTQPHLGFLF